MPTDPLPETPDAPREGALLIQAVPLNAGYALPETLASEVRAGLADYPGGFALARAYPIPDDIGPAFSPTPPPPAHRKGRGR